MNDVDTTTRFWFSDLREHPLASWKCFFGRHLWSKTFWYMPFPDLGHGKVVQYCLRCHHKIEI